LTEPLQAPRPLHVAMYVAAWPLGVHSSGILTYADSLRRELHRLGHRLSIFAGRLDEAGPGLYRVELTWRDRWLARLRRWSGDTSPAVFRFGSVIARRLRAVHSVDPIDIVEIEESFGFAGQVAHSLPIPVVVKLHGPAFLTTVDEELNTPFAQMRIRREGEALSQVAAIMAPARSTLDQALAHYHLTPTIAARVNNPLSADPETPLWTLAACDPQTILFVGRFDRAKGADAMLLAFKSLLGTRPELKLLFVGPDNGLQLSDGRTAQFAEYLRETFAPAQAQQVQYLGRLTPAQISVLRTRALVTVVSSRWENQSYATLEAMLQACPVVCVDAGGQRELVTHGISGLLARKDDVPDLCAQIEHILNHPEQASTMGIEARRYVLANHNPTDVAQATLAIYRQAMSTYAR